MVKAPVLCVLALGLAGCGAASGQTHASSLASDSSQATSSQATGRPQGAAGGSQAPGSGSAAAPIENRSRYRVVAQPAPGSCHTRGSGPFTRPDARCTPGASDPRVTQADIASTICRRGYTRSVRPPESVTYAEKRASMRAYGDHGSSRRYEYDHLIPLELGGAPNDAHNLWPEPGASPNPKDALENRLREQVCDQALSLAAARRAIASGWVAAYRRLLG
ncbi:MAG: hypothetical protein QOG59_414 [Solirubrobacteraceae bacterium]|nr:hypothetical protein [Solirubrobacteraceae bacterium]